MASKSLKLKQVAESLDKCPECGKVRYATKQQAYKMASAMQGPRGRQIMDAYKCQWCKGYHLTHHKNKRV